MLLGCDTWDPDLCLGDEAPSTLVDDSDGWLAPKQYCAACRAAYEHWLDSYEPPERTFDEQLAASLERRPR